MVKQGLRREEVNLRKAAENLIEAWDRGEFGGNLGKQIADLRQSLEFQEPVEELQKLMSEDGVTGVLIEVHRGPLSKSVREYGECSCPGYQEGDVRIEVTHD